MLGAGGAGSESQVVVHISYQCFIKVIGMLGLDDLCLGGVLVSRVNCVSIDMIAACR